MKAKKLLFFIRNGLITIGRNKKGAVWHLLFYLFLFTASTKPSNTDQVKNAVPPKPINGQYVAPPNGTNATANPAITKIASNPNVPVVINLLNLSLVLRIVFVSPLARQPYNAMINRPINIPNFAIMLVNI